MIQTSAVTIRGPSNIFIDDGSSQSRTSERKMQNLIREQMFEEEVRLQLKTKMRIFSKEIQNVIKRGIDYVEPLYKISNIDSNSMRKEMLI